MDDDEGLERNNSAPSLNGSTFTTSTSVGSLNLLNGGPRSYANVPNLYQNGYPLNVDISGSNDNSGGNVNNNNSRRYSVYSPRKNSNAVLDLDETGNSRFQYYNNGFYSPDKTIDEVEAVF